MTLIALKKDTTFDNVFEKHSVTLRVSELLFLLAVQKESGYIQPNVNHHFVNHNNTYRELEKAFRDSIEGNRSVSIEYDAVLGYLKVPDKSDASVLLPMYQVVTEAQIESTTFQPICTDSVLNQLKTWGSWKMPIEKFVSDKVTMQKFLDLVLEKTKVVVDSVKKDNLSFEDFLDKVPSVTDSLALAFLDGLHRTNCLVDMAKKSKENFHKILNSLNNVTINIFTLKQNNQVKREDMEILLQILQDKSGSLMIGKKTTVGHTVLDAFSVLSRAIRNNSKNAYLSVATYTTKRYNRTSWNHIMMEYSMGPNTQQIDNLKTRVYVEKFFKTFFGRSKDYQCNLSMVS